MATKKSGKEIRIAALVNQLTKEPSLEELPTLGNGHQDVMFKEICLKCQKMIHQSLSILDNTPTMTNKDAFQDELLNCLQLLQNVLQRQKKWCYKPNWKRRLHSKRYNAELVAFRKQFQECQKRFLADLKVCEKQCLVQAILPPSELSSGPIVGREKELQSVENEFNKDGKINIVSIIGGAGMGKSKCASHYALSWMEQDPSNRTVFWLSAASESSVRQGYLQILSRLGVDVDEEECGDDCNSKLARDTWTQLERLTRNNKVEWLLVYDGVPEAIKGLEGPGAFVPLFLPIASIKQGTSSECNGGGGGRILITSRCTQYEGETRLGHISSVKLTPLDDVDSLVLLLQDGASGSAALDDVSRDAATDIVKYCSGLPLALVAASKMAKDTSMQEFWQTLEKNDCSNCIVQKVHECIVCVLKHARKQGLGEVLEAFSQESKDVLHQDKISNLRKDELNRLLQLGLVQLDDQEHGLYKMHPLYQQAVLLHCKDPVRQEEKCMADKDKKSRKAVRFASTIFVHSKKTGKKRRIKKQQPSAAIVPCNKERGDESKAMVTSSSSSCSTTTKCSAAVRNKRRGGPVRVALWALVLVMLPCTVTNSAPVHVVEHHPPLSPQQQQEIHSV